MVEQPSNPRPLTSRAALHMERKLAAILAADVVGYSRLVGESEEETLSLLHACRAIIDGLVGTHHGRVFGSAGDSIVAEFSSPVEAVRCALEIQQRIERQNAGIAGRHRMQFRIGIHLGDVVVEGENLLGDGVNTASRLQSLADTGGVLISSDVYRQVHRKLDVGFADLGERRLKNIAEPIRVYRVLPAPLPWLHRQLRNNRRRLGFAAGVLLILFASVGGAAYLRRAPALWVMLFGDDGGLLPNQPSIAVLPLKSLSGGTQEDYFSDGLTNDITGELGRFQNLFVVASNSAFTYKDKPAKAQDIGRDLRVRYILEGTVQREHNRVRISAQLVDANSGRQLWAQRYDRKGEDIFAIQDEIITTVVAQLAVQVDSAERRRIMVSQTQSADAYDHYLKGRQLFDSYSREGNGAAKQEFSEAIRLDKKFARAYSWRGYAHLEDYKEGWTEDAKKSAALAFDDALTGVNLSPDDYYTHWTLATIYVERGDTTRALVEYETARGLNANDPDMLVEMADRLSFLGESDRAIEQIEKAQVLNPHFPEWYLWSLGLAYFQARRYDNAVAALERLSDPPNEAYLLLAIGRAMIRKPIPPKEILARLRTKDPEWTQDHLDRMPFAKEEDQQHWFSGVQMLGIPPAENKAP